MKLPSAKFTFPYNLKLSRRAQLLLQLVDYREPRMIWGGMLLLLNANSMFFVVQGPYDENFFP